MGSTITLTGAVGGSSSFELTQEVIDDALIEGTESYVLTLGSVSDDNSTFENITVDTTKDSVTGEIKDNTQTNPDTNTVKEDTTATATGNVLDNDEISAGTTVSLTSTPTDASDYGSLTLNSDGSYTFTLDNSKPVVQALSENATKDLVYKYAPSGSTTEETLTVTIQGTNDAPELDLSSVNGAIDTNTGYTADFIEGKGGIAISGKTGIADIDTTSAADQMSKAVIKITNPQTGDVLDISGIPTGTGITVNQLGNSVVELTGDASIADYQAVIDAITFNNTSPTPNEMDRLIDVVVTDEHGAD